MGLTCSFLGYSTFCPRVRTTLLPSGSPTFRCVPFSLTFYTLPQTTVQVELEGLRLLGATTKLPAGDGWAVKEETMAALGTTGVARYISHNVPSPNLIGTAA